jgi:hypothetical protein
MWVFLPPGKHMLEPGIHRYPFEELLEGDLPETISVQYGAVSYQIKATVKRPLLHADCTTERDIRVERYPYVAASEWLEPIEISNNWNNRVSYRIHIPMQAYGCDDSVPIQLDWHPLQEHACVHGVILTLMEHTRYHPVDHIIRREQRCVLQQMETFDDKSITGDWTRTFLLRLLPTEQSDSKQRLQVDCQTTWINVEHTLCVYILFEDASGLARVLATIPITILPISPQNIESELPDYAAHQQSPLLQSAPISPQPSPIPMIEGATNHATCIPPPATIQHERATQHTFLSFLSATLRSWTSQPSTVASAPVSRVGSPFDTGSAPHSPHATSVTTSPVLHASHLPPVCVSPSDWPPDMTSPPAYTVAIGSYPYSSCNDEDITSSLPPAYSPRP